MPECEPSPSGPVGFGTLFPQKTTLLFASLEGGLFRSLDPEGPACFAQLRDRWAPSGPFNCEVAAAVTRKC